MDVVSKMKRQCREAEMGIKYVQTNTQRLIILPGMGSQKALAVFGSTLQIYLVYGL